MGSPGKIPTVPREGMNNENQSGSVPLMLHLALNLEDMAKIRERLLLWSSNNRDIANRNPSNDIYFDPTAEDFIPGPEIHSIDPLNSFDAEGDLKKDFNIWLLKHGPLIKWLNSSFVNLEEFHSLEDEGYQLEPIDDLASFMTDDYYRLRLNHKNILTAVKGVVWQESQFQSLSRPSFPLETINIETLEEERINQIFKEILDGLEFLRVKGITHMGLSPKSIYMDDHKAIKIGNFYQASCTLSDSFVRDDTGFAPPESERHPNSDIYSLGKILHWLRAPRIPDNILSENPNTRPSIADLYRFLS